MNNRIGLLLKVKDVTASKFAEMIGVQPSNISHILSGRNKPSLDFVTKVAETFPDIRLEWLLFGKGQMYYQINENTVSETELKSVEKNIESPADSEIPDLFSQSYPSENSIIEEKQENAVKDLVNFEETSVEENNLQTEFNSEIEEVISEENKSEQIIETEIKTPEEKTKEFSEIPLKPHRIIMIYPDDTFDFIELKEK